MHTDDIYSRLLAGESSDDIAAELAKALNDAIDRIKEEEKARKEAELKAAQEKAAREAANQEKMNSAISLVTDALIFFATYYPSLGLTLDDKVSDEEIAALASLFVMLFDLEAAKPRKSNGAAKLPVNLDTKTADEVFTNFFKTIGL